MIIVPFTRTTYLSFLSCAMPAERKSSFRLSRAPVFRLDASPLSNAVQVMTDIAKRLIPNKTVDSGERYRLLSIHDGRVSVVVRWVEDDDVSGSNSSIRGETHMKR
eukprot:TRINITY_DN1057_c0_g1_i2.p2 TRINITY_DN1057_c0_g1~~TRINITY_DN1057_c0_g1_i2.p2  ORF type:complete len:106 (-),score=10.70 TRINITY_DN1057_c0_g1_i2:254-571(-)